MQACLIHQKVDPWLLGGLPLLAGLLAWLIPSQQNLGPLLQFSLILLSYPHFASSYYAFYRQKFVWKNYWFTALVIPLSLLLLLSSLLLLGRTDRLMGLAQCALGLLYWHYLKQAYGSCIWLGTMHSSALKRFPRKVLLVSCLLIGSLGFLAIQGHEGTHMVFGLYLPSFNVPAEVLMIFRVVTLAVLILCIILACRERPPGISIRDSMIAILPLMSLWLWFEPYFQTPFTLALLPALHGLQYLPFVGRLLWNDGHHGSRRGPAFLGLWTLLILAGYGGFYLLPRSLAPLPLEGLSSGLLILLNVHHYFIDASMWRLSRADVRERLLGNQRVP